jgi:hypothetical protein
MNLVKDRNVMAKSLRYFSFMNEVKLCSTPMATITSLAAKDKELFEDFLSQYCWRGYNIFPSLDLISYFLYTKWANLYISHVILNFLFRMDYMLAKVQHFHFMVFRYWLGGDRDDIWFVCSYYVLLGYNLVSWSCRQQ